MLKFIWGPGLERLPNVKYTCICVCVCTFNNRCACVKGIYICVFVCVAPNNNADSMERDGNSKPAQISEKFMLHFYVRHGEGGGGWWKGQGYCSIGPFIFGTLYMPDVLFILTDDASKIQTASAVANAKSFRRRILDWTQYIMHSPCRPLIRCDKACFKSLKLKLSSPPPLVARGALSKAVSHTEFWFAQCGNGKAARGAKWGRGFLLCFCCSAWQSSFPIFLYSILYYAVNFRIKSFLQK